MFLLCMYVWNVIYSIYIILYVILKFVKKKKFRVKIYLFKNQCMIEKTKKLKLDSSYELILSKLFLYIKIIYFYIFYI